MSFAKDLEQVVNKAITEFIKVVSKQYEIDEDELSEFWKQTGGKIEKTKASIKSDSGKCQARIQSGPNMGNQCKNNVSDKSPSGKYCSRHSSKEDDANETKSSKSKAKSSEKSGGCEAKYASGTKQGQRCHSKISDKSVTGLYCARHIGRENDSSTKKSKSKADESDNESDNDSEEEKVEKKVVEKPKPSSIHPKKSQYKAVTPENPTGENFVATISEHRIVFSKITKKATGVEEIVDEEAKTSKVVPLSDKIKEMLKANNVTV